MADTDTRVQLYDEYLALDNEYRKLADKLRPFTVTPESRPELRRLWDIGRQLETKLHELQEVSVIRRATPAPGSGF